jgi:hypothetical protein
MPGITYRVARLALLLLEQLVLFFDELNPQRPQLYALPLTQVGRTHRPCFLKLFLRRFELLLQLHIVLVKCQELGLGLLR